ncbi:helix-turn-helix domain-containing protein [Tabrizicola sp.]|uniref:helix-turn-helix domain-containing protein n=1 Tax=Tabrizicola sp. TaxID=2005166 RepID=UPI003F3D4F65
MTPPSYSSASHWYREGRQACYVRTMKSPGGILDLLEIEGQSGDVSRPGVPDIVLYQDVHGGCRIRGDIGGGLFDVTTKKGGLALAAPDFATTTIADTRHRVRCLALPMAHWQSVLDDAADGRFSFEKSGIYGRIFGSSAIGSALRNLWALCDDEGAPSRLLAQAAGCEILAELSRLGGAPFRPASGGLAPWAERRCLELMRARLSDDISLDELAAEVQLSTFHFARMFKRTVGVPPRAYLTRLRLEKASDLLERTDLPVTEIAFEVGYSSNQVLARVFLKNRRISPSDYRRIVRDPLRADALQ